MSIVWRLAVCAAGLVAGCGGRSATVQFSGEEVYARGKALFIKGKYQDALLEFQRLEAAVPPRADALADIRFHIAECHFGLADHLQAVHFFRRVADEFPNSSLAPFALLRAGDANAELWRRPELDPTYGTAALSVYRELVQRYPNSEPAIRARPKVQQLTDYFAEKDYKTGIFYLRRNAFDSAIIYFRSVVADYSQSHYVPKALIRLAEAYARIGYDSELDEICQHLRRFFPDTPQIDGRCPAVETP